MADDDNTPQGRTEMVGASVTPDELGRIKQLAAIRDETVSALVRENSVNELLAEHDRIMEMVGSGEPA